MFKELKETLYNTLERLYSATEKEKELTLNVEHAKVNSKKRNVSRVGEKIEKMKAAADIVIKYKKKPFPVNDAKEDRACSTR